MIESSRNINVLIVGLIYTLNMFIFTWCSDPGDIHDPVPKLTGKGIVVNQGKLEIQREAQLPAKRILSSKPSTHASTSHNGSRNINTAAHVSSSSSFFVDAAARKRKLEMQGLSAKLKQVQGMSAKLTAAGGIKLKPASVVDSKPIWGGGGAVPKKVQINSVSVVMDQTQKEENEENHEDKSGSDLDDDREEEDGEEEDMSFAENDESFYPEEEADEDYEEEDYAPKRRNWTGREGRVKGRESDNADLFDQGDEEDEEEQMSDEGDDDQMTAGALTGPTFFNTTNSSSGSGFSIPSDNPRPKKIRITAPTRDASSKPLESFTVKELQAFLKERKLTISGEYPSRS
jgi:hypothetical protein